MQKHIKRSLTALVTILLACNVNAKSIDKIIVFGDSLSDNGNTYNLTTSLSRYIPLVPVAPKSPPYFNGRFSNGEVWVEAVARDLNVPLVDYAYGGAWAESSWDSKKLIPYGLDTQINMYLVGAVTDTHKDQHLYVIWSGGNDYLDGRSDAEYATDNTVYTIEKQIDWLAYYGAKQFMVFNLPDLGWVPNSLNKGADFATQESHLTQLHNEKLAAAITRMRAKYPQIQIIAVDMIDYFMDITLNPGKYGLTTVNKACFDGGYYLTQALANNQELAAAKQVNLDIMHNAVLRTAYLNQKAYQQGAKSCVDPDKYLYWDQVHPTRVAHAALAKAMEVLLADNDIQGQ